MIQTGFGLAIWRWTWTGTIVLCTLVSGLLSAQDRIEFNRDVRPILAENCFDCHGFDAKARKADLRLDTLEGATADRGGSSAVSPGNVDRSLLWERINSDDSELIMPPVHTKKSLTDEEKAVLRRWIEEGAAYQKHWAFELPVERPVPEFPSSAGVRTPVDSFLLAKLSSHQLSFRPDADKSTLIRRVAFTLTGLPPTLDEQEAYFQDTSESAYEAMVDRYLASPHYGEEQARYWLDVARYADTHGLHLDNERWMWVYRDWVVSAFNQNLPFDQFTVWQIAGDQLPEPTLEQLVATGFNRCNVTTSEGGAISEEWLYRYAVDRTSTTMQAWMGLTAGCAVCHDHKYDPVTQKDFYSMYSFFYSATDPAMDGNVRDTAPWIKVPNAEQKAALESAQAARDKARSELDAALMAGPAIASIAAAPTGSESELPVERSDVVIDDAFPHGTRSRNTSRDPVIWRTDPGFGAPSGRRVLEPAFGSDYDLTIELTLIPVMVPQEDGRLTFSLRVDPMYRPSTMSLQLDAGRKLKLLWNDDGAAAADKSELRIGEVPRHGDWTEVSVSFAELQADAGSRITSLVLTHNGGRIWIDNLRISGRTAPAADPLASFRKWWELGKGSNPDGLPGDLKALYTGGPKDDCPPEQLQSLVRFWQVNVQRSTASPAAELRQVLDTLTTNVAIIEDSIPGTFVFGELATPREAFVMLRGQYNKPGDKVEPAVPAAFPPLRMENGQPFPPGQRARRLDLARWLLSEENPLTSRVTVNRFWQQVFGTGLVKTSDDFGTRGDLPSHPELLDWLALEFRNSGWDVKQLYRLLLTSTAFRQSSSAGGELRQLDPENRLLAHGPRFRLDAEQLRDNALFVSGLMNQTPGGRGALPYQPPDIWEPVGYENSNTRFYLQDTGASLYRRSVYCFLKRTAPPPFMSNFDGPNREQFCTRRERSNTPLQALQLMNDVQHFEAARALAERMIAEAGSAASDRIAWLYRVVLSRNPDAEELRELTIALERQQELFKGDEPAAAKVVDSGESVPRRIAGDVETATWTMMANLVLNLDETVNRN